MDSKKRKRTPETIPETIPETKFDTSKPTNVFEPKEGRAYTLSIALPGSIISNAQTPELQTLLAGRVARALAVFCVDEVVVFDDGPIDPAIIAKDYNYKDRQSSYNGYSDPNYFLAHILSYLECPPHIKRDLFPMHPDLRYAGALPPLDMPHHLRQDGRCQYREGVTLQSTDVARPTPQRKDRPNRHKPRENRLVKTGLKNDVYVEATIPINTRVTVKFSENEPLPKRYDDERHDMLLATAVAPSAPREEAGYYWGYSVRSAASLSEVLTECPFDGGYDVTAGTSERGVPVSDLEKPGQEEGPTPEFDHMLIVFGGVAGLEVAVKADKELDKLGVRSPESLFDYWVNLVPGQGSRTIRTEEAVWLGLMGLRDVVSRKGRR